MSEAVGWMTHNYKEEKFFSLLVPQAKAKRI